MNAKKHKHHLKELCRACLKSLKNTNTDFQAPDTLIDNNNLLVPNLCQLFLYFTSMDVSRETEIFPKLLCQLCLNKLMEYDNFRKLTLRSTAKLYEILNAEKDDDDRQEETIFPHDDMDVVRVKSEKISDDDADDDEVVSIKKEYNRDNDSENDDDKLLLPELANLPLTFKHEPYFETTDTQVVSFSSIDEEAEAETNDDPYYNEDPSFPTNYSEDDADDEELFLSNGAANTSSSSLYTAEGNQRNSTAAPKRDRNQKKSMYCNICNKQFYKKFYLDAHIRGVHMGEKEPFQCLMCFKSFTGYNQLYLHKRTQHKGESMTEEPDSRINHFDNSFGEETMQYKEVIPRNGEMEGTGEYTCQICTRNYSSRRALNEHTKRHRQIKEHVCRVCGVAKVTRTELQTHMRVHLRNLEKFPCPQCPQVFNHKNAISRHVKVVHEGQRRFPCSYCPKKFSTRNTKMCHERLHTGERPFSCGICNKGFVQQESLRSHMKNHDKMLRKHVCSYCSQRFITLKNLLDHEKRHRGNKPHICNVCSKGFYKNEDLQSHFNACHGRSNDNDIKDKHQGFSQEEDQQDNSEGNNETDEHQGGFSELEPPTDSGSQNSN